MPPSQSSKLSPAAVIGPGRVGLALAIFLALLRMYRRDYMRRSA